MVVYSCVLLYYLVLYNYDYSVVITTREKEMAKRFMDNSIFEKQWFRQLPIRLKIVWFYLINKCNHAGIWECDVDLLSFQIGEEYTLKEILEAFGDNIQELGDNKYYLTKFISFQYGLPLNPNVKVHLSVIKLLEKYNIELDKTYVSIKDKEKDIDKGKDIETRKQCFAKRVDKETLDMHINPQMLKEFIDYWTEHNDGGSVLRYEQQSIFNIKKRMATWQKNDKKFNNGMKFQPSDEDVEKREARIEADYQEQQKKFRQESDNIATDEDRKKALGLK